ncbi:hypothetical protein IQ243_16030 [Nostocales cyanobacterium LEGE 11386]|nr:hypothetical protein [Nostocales cyanobacterium LEGE 11386]
MSENNTSNNSKIFQYLSEEEQESLVGGQNFNPLGDSKFFFQKTDIQTEAENKLNLADAESGSQITKYNLSQVTMASSITFGLPNFNSHSNSLNNLITKILSGLFS